MRHSLARLGLLCWLFAPTAHAAGQFSFSGAIESDYRFRGLSISHGRPDARLDLAYDRPGGLYAGMALVAAPQRDRAAVTSYTAYAGWVSLPAAGISWDGGVSHTHISDRERYDYDEIYAGLMTKAVSARLSYSPRYYGRDVQTVYADISGGRRVSQHWRVFAHAGLLTRLSGARLRQRHDISAGIATSVYACDVRLALTQAPALYAWGHDDGGTALVLSATHAF